MELSKKALRVPSSSHLSHPNQAVTMTPRHVPRSTGFLVHSLFYATRLLISPPNLIPQFFWRPGRCPSLGDQVANRATKIGIEVISCLGPRSSLLN